jgi:Lon protease-like protein
VLLPGVVLPLLIFEPRYRAMMQAVTAAPEDQQLIAMTLLQGDSGPLYETKHAPIHDVVCVGRVIDHQKLPDGRYNLMLLGCARARVVSEDRSRPYRRVVLESLTTEDDLDERQGARIVEEIQELLQGSDGRASVGSCVFEGLVKGGADLSTVIDLLTYHLLPREDCELKQRVLEETAVSVRARILLRWLYSLVEAVERSKHTSRPWPPLPSVN